MRLNKVILFFGGYLLFQCSNAQIHLEKAIVKPEFIDSIISLEKQFAPFYEVPAPADKNWFEYKPGNKKILFVAGHATAQTRLGEIKYADGGTGSLILELHALRDVPILYTTYLSPSDPNYYDNNTFKDSLDKLLDIIKPTVVIDLHASHPFRPYDVDFGTMNGKSYGSKKPLFDTLVTKLYENGLRDLSLDLFAAEKYQTVTKFVSGKGYPCIQLEINSNFLEADSGDVYAQKTAKLLQGLLRYIDAIEPLKSEKEMH